LLLIIIRVASLMYVGLDLKENNQTLSLINKMISKVKASIGIMLSRAVARGHSCEGAPRGG
jgi:hypothetical protein